MPDPINLNKVRKAKRAVEAKASAAENRVRFGLSKAQKIIQRLDAIRAQRDLDGKKRD